MSVLNVITVPHATLTQRSNEVENITDEVRARLDDMLETMYHESGIGLAANQVNDLRRLVVIDLSGEPDSDTVPLKMINPEIIWSSDETSLWKEGCLSVPQQYADVERPALVKVRYLDVDGKFQEVDGEGLMSHCLQHEIDHLNGIRFIDHLSRLKRDTFIRKVGKLTKDMDIL